MEPQGKECSPACRGSRELLLQGSLFVICIWAPWSPTTSALLCSPASLLTGPLSSISAWLGGMAAISPVHKLSQFKNLKKLSSELLNLCGPPPHSHLCAERAGPFVSAATSSKEAARRACGDVGDSRRKCCDSEGISRKVSQKAVTSVLS